MDSKIIQLAKTCGIEAAAILAFIEVETGGKGFDDVTGKIIIQFEPVWFKREVPYAPSGLWSVNTMIGCIKTYRLNFRNANQIP